MGSMGLFMLCNPIGKHMEKRKLIRVSPKGIGFYTWKLWRITKGVTKAETGKLRLRLYYKGKLIPHSRTSHWRDWTQSSAIPRNVGGMRVSRHD